MSQLDFTVDVYQNEYLLDGGKDVNAVISVTAPQAVSAPAVTPDGAEIIIVDCSGSMNAPQTKMAAARTATTTALNGLRDGISFAVIAGTDRAQPIYPPDGSMAVADPRTRVAAKRAAVVCLRPGGGTAIGQWLRLAHHIFASKPSALRHAILLTDGKNEHETPEQLEEAIKLCEGVFSCDCRGVGTDWNVEELRRISTALLGTVDIVPDPAGLSADFAAMMKAAMGKRVADVALRIWTPRQASIRFLRQVAPAVEDLTDRRAQSGAQVGDYATGAWGSGETRDYHLCLQVAPVSAGHEMLAARVSLALGSTSAQHLLGQGLVKATWTDDEALATRINPHVAHYTGQTELAELIHEGLEARKDGNEDTAKIKLGRAVALAQSSRHDDTAKLLARVVDVVDAATGTIRLKKKVAQSDEMTLDTRSTRTVRTRK